MDQEPARCELPSLSELNTDDVQTALAAVHDAVSNLAADLQELRTERKELGERLGALEEHALFTKRARNHSGSATGAVAGTADSLAFSEDFTFLLTDTKPAGGSQTAGSAGAAGTEAFVQELRQLGERVRCMESSVEQHREQQIIRLNTQDGLISMRLQAMELELAACMRPGDLEGQRQELQELRARLAETQLPEAVRVLGQELRGELQAKADGLREDLLAVSGSVTSKLQKLDEHMAAIEDRELRAALTGGGGTAGGRSSGPPSETSAGGRGEEEATSSAGALLQCRRLAEEARRTAMAATEGLTRIEGRLSCLAEELLGASAAEAAIAEGAQASRGHPSPAAAGHNPEVSIPHFGSANLLQRVVQLESRVAALSAPTEEGRLQTAEHEVQVLSHNVEASAGNQGSLLEPGHTISPLAGTGGATGFLHGVRTAGGRMGAIEAALLSQETTLREALDMVGRGTTETPTANLEQRLLALEEGLAELRAQGLMPAPLGVVAPAGEMGEAVAALAVRAQLLEEQLEGGGDCAAGGPGPQRMAIGHLEERVEALSRELDVARQRQADALLQGAEDHRAVEARVRELAEGLRAVREGSLPQVEQELRRLREQRAAAAVPSPKHGGASRAGVSPGQGPQPQPPSLEGAVAELDKRFEARLASVWRELTGHAEAAATRADKLERNLFTRLERVESSCTQLRRNSATENAAKPTTTVTADFSKQLEWLEFRMSWLEWSTGGEKRSFSRPLDAKAAFPAPPSTAGVTVVGQPEDVEMWAREPGGRLRPRRRIQTALAPSAEPAPAEQLGPLRGSRSHGRLPTRGS